MIKFRIEEENQYAYTSVLPLTAIRASAPGCVWTNGLYRTTGDPRYPGCLYERKCGRNGTGAGANRPFVNHSGRQALTPIDAERQLVGPALFRIGLPATWFGGDAQATEIRAPPGARSR
jgi:hypothetical protein